MGAKAWVWFTRVAGAVAAMVGVAVVAALPIPWWLRAAILAVGAAVGLDQAFRRIPAFDPLGRVRWRLGRGQEGGKVCALTFDDGPSPSTARTLDILKEHGVAATFFVLAENAERHPDLVRRASAEGHAVAIHGVGHARLNGAGENEVEREVSGAIESLERIGVKPAPLYRTPHGFKSRAVFTVAKRFGLTPWAWSRGVWDTDRPAPKIIVKRATRCARPGMVLLLHDGRDVQEDPDVGPMLTALPTVIEELRGRGFDFVKLDDPAL